MNEPVKDSITSSERLNVILRLRANLIEPGEASIPADYYAEAGSPTLLAAKWKDTDLPMQIAPTPNSASGLVIQMSTDGTAYRDILVDDQGWDGTTPYDYRIPLENLKPDGPRWFRGVPMAWGLPSTPFTAMQVLLDSVAPYQEKATKDPDQPQPAETIVTQVYLDSNSGQLQITIPAYDDWADKDKVFLFLEKELPTVPVPPVIPFAMTGAQGTTLQIPAAALKAKGDGNYYLTYLLRDLAGNDSAFSFPSPLSLVLSDLPPASLPAPELISGKRAVELEDLRSPVDLRVLGYPNQQAIDLLQVQWGGQALESFTANEGGLSTLTTVPRERVVADFANGTVPKDTAVIYTVNRLGWESAASGVLTLSVDLRYPGIVNPDFPDPVNIDLIEAHFISASKEDDEIPKDDLGKAGTFTFKIPDEVEEDDELRFFWQNQPAGVYTILSSDAPTDSRTLPVAWEILALALGYSSGELFYRLHRPGLPESNFQQAPSTHVVTSALPVIAPEVSFPNSTPANGRTVLRCSDVRDENDLVTVPTPGPGMPAREDAVIVVRIPDLSSYFVQPGDKLTFMWQTYKGIDGTVPIDATGGYYEEEFDILPGQEKGFDILVPYIPYGRVTYKPDGCSSTTEAKLEVYYSVERAANPKPLESKPPANVGLVLWTTYGDCWENEVCVL